MPENLLTTPEAAKMLCLTDVCLLQWRQRGVGPKCVLSNNGKRFWYPESSLRAFARERIAKLEREIARRRAALGES